MATITADTDNETVDGTFFSDTFNVTADNVTVELGVLFGLGGKDTVDVAAGVEDLTIEDFIVGSDTLVFDDLGRDFELSTREDFLNDIERRTDGDIYSSFGVDGDDLLLNFAGGTNVVLEGVADMLGLTVLGEGNDTVNTGRGHEAYVLGDSDQNTINVSRYDYGTKDFIDYDLNGGGENSFDTLVLDLGSRFFDDSASWVDSDGVATITTAEDFVEFLDYVEDEGRHNDVEIDGDNVSVTLDPRWSFFGNIELVFRGDTLQELEGVSGFDASDY